MQFDLTESLLERTLVRISVSLLMQDEARKSVGKIVPKTYNHGRILCGSCIHDCHLNGELFASQVEQLPLPKELKNALKNYVRIIGSRIIDWRVRMAQFVREDIILNNLHNICWTPQGTVDELRTAKVLLKNKNLDKFERYTLSCVYFLQDDILPVRDDFKHLLQSAPANCFMFQNRTIEEDFCFKIMNYGNDHTWGVKFWTMQSSEAKISDFIFSDDAPPQSCILYFAIRSSNTIAVQSFFQHEPPERRSLFLKSAFNYLFREITVSYQFGSQEKFECHKMWDLGNLLVFLMSHMTAEQQSDAIRSVSRSKVLLVFLKWPLQRCFLQFARFVLECMDESEIAEVVGSVLVRKQKWSDYDYDSLITEFLLMCSESSHLQLEKARKELLNYHIEDEVWFKEENILLLGNALSQWKNKEVQKVQVVPDKDNTTEEDRLRKKRRIF